MKRGDDKFVALKVMMKHQEEKMFHFNFDLFLATKGIDLIVPKGSRIKVNFQLDSEMLAMKMTAKMHSIKNFD